VIAYDKHCKSHICWHYVATVYTTIMCMRPTLQQLKEAHEARALAPAAAAAATTPAPLAAAVASSSSAASLDARDDVVSDVAALSAADLEVLECIRQHHVVYRAGCFLEKFLLWQQRKADSTAAPATTLQSTVNDLEAWKVYYDGDTAIRSASNFCRNGLRKQAGDAGVGIESATAQQSAPMLQQWANFMHELSRDAYSKLCQVHTM
jgi:hypothetical protein